MRAGNSRDNRPRRTKTSLRFRRKRPPHGLDADVGEWPQMSLQTNGDEPVLPRRNLAGVMATFLSRTHHAGPRHVGLERQPPWKKHTATDNRSHSGSARGGERWRRSSHDGGLMKKRYTTTDVDGARRILRCAEARIHHERAQHEEGDSRCSVSLSTVHDGHFDAGAGGSAGRMKSSSRRSGGFELKSL